MIDDQSLLFLYNDVYRRDRRGKKHSMLRVVVCLWDRICDAQQMGWLGGRATLLAALK